VAKCTIPISIDPLFGLFMPLSAPPSMEKEHEEIWQLLLRIQHLSGKTGSIAEKLAKDLKAHIDKEESLALPLLGILRDIADGKLKNGVAKRASLLGYKLEKEYLGMLHGHKEMYKILERLKRVGAEEGHLTAVRFAEALEAHSKQEEEVLYPAAIVAGQMASKRTRSKTAVQT
jgi:hemerythrin-like domain-containing protein